MKDRTYIKIAGNEKGIALVLVLILSLIGLAMVSALLFMVTQGTTLSGGIRAYRTAEEAGVGVAQAAGDMLANRGQSAVLLMPECDCNNPIDYTDNTDSLGNVDPFCNKICNPTQQYNAGPATDYADEDAGTAGLQFSVNPTTNPDGQWTGGDFTAFWKIVDTIEGNSDTGGIVSSGELTGGGVVSSSAGLVNPPHTPYIYRLEVQAERTAGARERARFSLFYGY